MPKIVKMTIDSVVEELVRARLTSNGKRATINLNRDALRGILNDNLVVDGRSYEITLSDDRDLDIIWSGQFDRNSVLNGTVTARDTTKEDLAEIRRLQKRLGLRRSR